MATTTGITLTDLYNEYPDYELSSEDLFYLVDYKDGSTDSRAVTLGDIVTYIIGNNIITSNTSENIMSEFKSGVDLSNDSDDTRSPSIRLYKDGNNYSWQFSNDGITYTDLIASGDISLQPATSTTLGGIKVGSGLSITSDGALSVNELSWTTII